MRHATVAAAVLALVASGALAAPASAATVRMTRVVEEDEGETAVYGTVTITAGAGERNMLALTFVGGPGNAPDDLLVTDATAPLAAGARCLQVRPDTVRCRDASVADIEEVAASLGDMDDAASYTGPELGDLAIAGGAGDDMLTAAWATLDGGAGNDTLTGRPVARTSRATGATTCSTAARTTTTSTAAPATTSCAAAWATTTCTPAGRRATRRPPGATCSTAARGRTR